MKTEITIVDRRNEYTKALARCAIHDPDKYALLSERLNRYEEGSEMWLTLMKRKLEVSKVLDLWHSVFWWEGIV